MSDVEFEEEMYKPLTNIKKDSGVVGFLTRHGIVKNSKVAMIIVVALCLLAIGSSIFVIYRKTISTQILPYSKIPASAKEKLPLPVQLLYSQKK